MKKRRRWKKKLERTWERNVMCVGMGLVGMGTSWCMSLLVVVIQCISSVSDPGSNSG